MKLSRAIDVWIEDMRADSRIRSENTEDAGADRDGGCVMTDVPPEIENLREQVFIDQAGQRKVLLSDAEAAVLACEQRMGEAQHAVASRWPTAVRGALHDAWTDGWFTAETTRRPAASPDERLREAATDT